MFPPGSRYTHKAAQPGVKYIYILVWMLLARGFFWVHAKTKTLWFLHTRTQHLDHLSLTLSFVHTSLTSAVETWLLSPSESPRSSPTGHCMVTPDRPHQTKRHSTTHPFTHIEPHTLPLKQTDKQTWLRVKLKLECIYLVSDVLRWNVFCLNQSVSRVMNSF